MEKIDYPEINLSNVRESYYALHRFWRRIIPKNKAMTEMQRREVKRCLRDIRAMGDHYVINYSRYVVFHARNGWREFAPGEPRRTVWLCRYLRSEAARIREDLRETNSGR